MCHMYRVRDFVYKTRVEPFSWAFGWFVEGKKGDIFYALDASFAVSTMEEERIADVALVI